MEGHVDTEKGFYNALDTNTDTSIAQHKEQFWEQGGSFPPALNANGHQCVVLKN